MSSQLIDLITSPEPERRNTPLEAVCRDLSPARLMAEAQALDRFRRTSENLYERVRALFFLYAIHRFHLPARLGEAQPSALSRGPLLPFAGYHDLLQRRFEEAINAFLAIQEVHGPSEAISSGLAESYHQLGFQTLADQVRRSVRSVRGNQWMFRTGHPLDQPLRVRPEVARPDGSGLYPILQEATPVRMDLSHSAWSDIFFLGMDYPEGARVLNVSIDLAVRGRDPQPRPPVEAYFRVIDEPVLRLVSVDLKAQAEIASLGEVFDFGRDYLGLLKAAIIAAGIVPPGLEGSGEPLTGPGGLLDRLVGPGRGIEIVSRVNGIPKGSRLAVSTNLLACLISVCMRATGQTQSLTGGLTEQERRTVAARAILGEWLGGSGGGWQDSGGVWPDMKLIQGALAGPDDPEFGISRGRLLPSHHIFGPDEISPATRQSLQESLILVHGGMAQNVGPILEQVTEKYLLRSGREWQARQQAIHLLDEIIDLLRAGKIRGIGEATTRNFFGPIQAIIPRATTLYTEELIQRARAEFGPDFWGFWMLGGASGGGMGFILDPARREAAQERLQAIMDESRARLQHALPFAMNPVVYDFAINRRGTYARWWGDLMPPDYYGLILPQLLRQDVSLLSPGRQAEFTRFGQASHREPAIQSMIPALFEQVLPQPRSAGTEGQDLESLLDQLGFDRVQHERIQADLRRGRIGLAQNRLPASTVIEDAGPGDVADGSALPQAEALTQEGLRMLAEGRAAVVTLAAGVGSRWTEGAGVVKAINPFVKLGGRHRTFVEIHLAKSQRTGERAGQPLPHIITTSYLTDGAIRDFLAQAQAYGYPGPLLLSQGRAVGLRMIPTARDLRFAWEETAQQRLDEQQQKMRESGHAALIGWAQSMGEAQDYRDNLPLQCLHPVGHWFEIPSLLQNGSLARLLAERPQLQTLMLHNIDVVGADVDPALLAWHTAHGALFSVEVIRRRVEDRGGGLARVDGHLRLVEGLALPREEDEFGLSYYNTNTFWIQIDPLLALFGLSRADLAHPRRVNEAVRSMAARMPTYITLKDVKKRWGYGQEDIFPVAQFEKLWGDMTGLPEAACRYVAVPRQRGQNLKDVAQLDGWLRDGSAAYVAALCGWEGGEDDG